MSKFKINTIKNWQEDLLQALLSSSCELQFFDKLSSNAYDLGFDYCAYGLRMPLPISQPKIIMFNNYPVLWQNLYQTKNYLSIDPTVQHGIHSSFPLIWSDEIFSSAREMWEDARSFGLHVGWAQSNCDTRNVRGMLTLARSQEPLTESELLYKGYKMDWLAHVAHFGMSQFITEKYLPETEVRLTNREITVLRWTADGKTSSEISEILGISERTINFHINNSMMKLGTANKLAAALKAAVLGMLY